MSAGGDYIGSRISLISKAGIRYEGFLYSVDPKESTVALSQGKNLVTMVNNNVEDVLFML